PDPQPRPAGPGGGGAEQRLRLRWQQRHRHARGAVAMTGLAINGFGVLAAAGDSPEALAATLRRPAPAAVDVPGTYPESLPSPRAHALTDFNVRAELGRKGTSFFDRRTALTVAVCRRALDDAKLTVEDGNRHRIGVVLGTTVGSARSSVDYAVETFTQDP